MTPLFSTAYLPPIDYVAAIACHNEVLIEAKETFPKQTYRNRARIATSGGVRDLIVPTVRNNHSRTDEVGIDYKDRWNIIHFRTLTAAYAASPYWLYYKDDLEQLVTTHYDRLLDLNSDMLRWMLKKMKIDCTVEYTTDYIHPTGDPYDYRYLFSPKLISPIPTPEPYYQVFSAQQPFIPNLSAIDLLMNLGPESRNYILKIAQNSPR